MGIVHNFPIRAPAQKMQSQQHKYAKERHEKTVKRFSLRLLLWQMTTDKKEKQAGKQQMKQ